MCGPKGTSLTLYPPRKISPPPSCSKYTWMCHLLVGSIKGIKRPLTDHEKPKLTGWSVWTMRSTAKFSGQPLVEFNSVRVSVAPPLKLKTAGLVEMTCSAKKGTKAMFRKFGALPLHRQVQRRCSCSTFSGSCQI